MRKRALHIAFVFFVVTTGVSLAIPQNFNQGRGLFLGGGAAFENLVTESATWAPGATFPGEWAGSDGSRVQTLKEEALVFGLPAAQVSAERDKTRLNTVRVVFRENGKKQRAPLIDRVLQNIRAFTGEGGKDDGKGVRVFQ